MKTELLENTIAQCENIEEYKRLVEENASLNHMWNAYVSPMLKKARLTNPKIAAGCGDIHVNTAEKFSKYIPIKRSTVIMIAMMLRMSVDEANDLLVRGARYHRLYSRNPEDAIWIYLLSKGGSDYPAALFNAYWNVYLEEQDRYLNSSQKMGLRVSKGTVLVHDEIEMAASRAHAMSIQTAASDCVYRDMVRSHIPEYTQGYWRLMEYIDRKFRAFNTSANVMFEDHHSFRKAYYDQMHNLREKRELPSRLFLIALGVHLEMDKDDINHMLELAGMGRLYAKDWLEGSIVFLLEELYWSMPSVFFKTESNPGYGELLDSKEDSGLDLIRRGGQMDDDDERLCDYIARRLKGMGTLDPNERRVKAFLRLL